MGTDVSICIPTRNRPMLLKQTLESCFVQRYRPLLISIGDNSTNTETREFVQSLAPPDGISIDYRLNEPPLTQRDNFCELVARATTEFVSLLHDDDCFTPGGLDTLMEAIRARPDIVGVIGLEDIIDMDGKVLAKESFLANEQFYRGQGRADRCYSMWFSSLTGQFPPNGYVLRTEFAQAAVRQLPMQVGSALDTLFEIALAQTSGNAPIFVVPQTTHLYRITPGAESDDMDHLPVFEALRVAPVPAEYRVIWKERLEGFLMSAIARNIRHGRLDIARDLIRSEHYPARQRLTARGLYHLAIGFLPLGAGLLARSLSVRRRRQAVDWRGGVSSGYFDPRQS